MTQEQKNKLSDDMVIACLRNEAAVALLIYFDGVKMNAKICLSAEGDSIKNHGNIVFAAKDLANKINNFLEQNPSISEDIVQIHDRFMSKKN